MCSLCIGSGSDTISSCVCVCVCVFMCVHVCVCGHSLYTFPSFLLPIPRGPAANAGGVRLSLRKDPQETRLTSEELVATCSVICTADYCLETTQQVEHGGGGKVETF